MEEAEAAADFAGTEAMPSVADVVCPATTGDAAAASTVLFPTPLFTTEGRDRSIRSSLPLSSESGGVGRYLFCLGMVRQARAQLGGQECFDGDAAVLGGVSFCESVETRL